MGQDIVMDDDPKGEGDAEGLGIAEVVANTGDGKNKVRQRTIGYNGKEDQCICKSWVAISQHPICGT
jgi:hypothetical protein